jgi:hypothetical protein
MYFCSYCSKELQCKKKLLLGNLKYKIFVCSCLPNNTEYRRYNWNSYALTLSLARLAPEITYALPFLYA